MFTCGSGGRLQLAAYAYPACPAARHDRGRCHHGAAIDSTALEHHASGYSFECAAGSLGQRASEDVMLARAILVIVFAALLTGCIDSERFRNNLGGPSGPEKAEQNPGK
jgi:hypothetical protein